VRKRQRSTLTQESFDVQNTSVVFGLYSTVSSHQLHDLLAEILRSRSICRQLSEKLVVMAVVIPGSTRRDPPSTTWSSYSVDILGDVNSCQRAQEPGCLAVVWLRRGCRKVRRLSPDALPEAEVKSQPTARPCISVASRVESSRWLAANFFLEAPVIASQSPSRLLLRGS